jgi:hypothetical protein
MVVSFTLFMFLVMASRHEVFSAFPDKTLGKPYQLPDAGEGGGSSSLDWGLVRAPHCQPSVLKRSLVFPVEKGWQAGATASTHRRRGGAPQREVNALNAGRAVTSVWVLRAPPKGLRTQGTT